MKPLGRKPMRYNFPDRHLRENGKRVQNWWEDESEPCNKAREKRNIRKEIEEETR